VSDSARVELVDNPGCCALRLICTSVARVEMLLPCRSRQALYRVRYYIIQHADILAEIDGSCIGGYIVTPIIQP